MYCIRIISEEDFSRKLYFSELVLKANGFEGTGCHPDKEKALVFETQAEASAISNYLKAIRFPEGSPSIEKCN